LEGIKIVVVTLGVLICALLLLVPGSITLSIDPVPKRRDEQGKMRMDDLHNCLCDILFSSD